MKDKSLTEHYQQILGATSPWTVREVRLDVERLINEVRLTLPPDAIWGCPKCHSRMHVKEWRTRRWRHLDSCQFKTILEAAVPVVECGEHGYFEWIRRCNSLDRKKLSRAKRQLRVLALDFLAGISSVSAGDSRVVRHPGVRPR